MPRIQRISIYAQISGFVKELTSLDVTKATSPRSLVIESLVMAINRHASLHPYRPVIKRTYCAADEKMPPILYNRGFNGSGRVSTVMQQSSAGDKVGLKDDTV